MRRSIQTFNERQTMNSPEFEVFHYKDARPGGIALHNHDFYEIYLFLGGEVEYQIENAIYPLKRGDLLLVSPLELHRPIPREPVSVYERVVLWVDRRYLRLLKQLHGLDIEHCFDPMRVGRRNLLRPKEELSALMALLSILLREEEGSQEYGSEFMRSSALLQVLILLSRMSQKQLGPSGSNDSDPLIDQVFDYINSHITEDLTMDRLSALMYVDSGTLSRRFRRQLGTSIPEYVRHKRLTLARNLLLEGEKPLRAAIACGYKDYSSFFRAFKAQYQLSPRELVASLRGKA